MKTLLIALTIFASGCATGRQATTALHPKVAWVPCEVEVVTYEDTSKTVAKMMKTQWYCENPN